MLEGDRPTGLLSSVRYVVRLFLTLLEVVRAVPELLLCSSVCPNPPFALLQPGLGNRLFKRPLFPMVYCFSFWSILRFCYVFSIQPSYLFSVLLLVVGCFLFYLASLVVV